MLKLNMNIHFKKMKERNAHALKNKNLTSKRNKLVALAAHPFGAPKGSSSYYGLMGCKISV